FAVSIFNPENEVLTLAGSGVMLAFALAIPVGITEGLLANVRRWHGSVNKKMTRMFLTMISLFMLSALHSCDKQTEDTVDEPQINTVEFNLTSLDKLDQEFDAINSEHAAGKNLDITLTGNWVVTPSDADERLPRLGKISELGEKSGVIITHNNFGLSPDGRDFNLSAEQWKSWGAPSLLVGQTDDNKFVVPVTEIPQFGTSADNIQYNIPVGQSSVELDVQAPESIAAVANAAEKVAETGVTPVVNITADLLVSSETAKNLEKIQKIVGEIGGDGELFASEEEVVIDANIINGRVGKNDAFVNNNNVSFNGRAKNNTSLRSNGTSTFGYFYVQTQDVGILIDNPANENGGVVRTGKLCASKSVLKGKGTCFLTPDTMVWDVHGGDAQKLLGIKKVNQRQVLLQIEEDKSLPGGLKAFDGVNDRVLSEIETPGGGPQLLEWISDFKNGPTPGVNAYHYPIYRTEIDPVFAYYQHRDEARYTPKPANIIGLNISYFGDSIQNIGPVLVEKNLTKEEVYEDFSKYDNRSLQKLKASFFRINGEFDASDYNLFEYKYYKNPYIPIHNHQQDIQLIPYRGEDKYRHEFYNHQSEKFLYPVPISMNNTVRHLADIAGIPDDTGLKIRFSNRDVIIGFDYNGPESHYDDAVAYDLFRRGYASYRPFTSSELKCMDGVYINSYNGYTRKEVSTTSDRYR
ncbi:MAG: hypothetical protein LBS54_02535, partial [Dysgonamonadaceae bacterium]|nr:hypothetical protein [Dysgonamonadaceae bacterium]